MQMGLFDEENRMEKLSRLGDSLLRLNDAIQWEIFRPVLDKTLRKESKSAGGCPPYDRLFMFKILILQRIYNLK